MADNPFDLLRILERIEDRTVLDAPERLFWSACVGLVRHRLPAEAADWIELAESYRVGRATSEQLTEARVAAWRLSERQDVSKFAMRVLIGSLYPDRPERELDDVFESIYYCISFTRREGVPLERIAEEMRGAFHHVLP